MSGKTCLIEGCTKPTVVREWCKYHYDRGLKKGEILALARVPVSTRFLSKVQKTETCWLWIGAKTRDGYGQLRVGPMARYAHRVAYELLVGPIPSGLVLDHLCRTPSCVNPAHLEPVPQRTNVLRGVSPAAQQARQTECRLMGHPLDEANTIRNRDGKRRCRTCYNAARRVA